MDKRKDLALVLSDDKDHFIEKVPSKVQQP